MTKVISLGGSLIIPEAIDLEFIKQFKQIALNFLNKEPDRKLILVVGGGAIARTYQEACKKLDRTVSNDSLDWLGIAATRLNATLIKTLFNEEASAPIVDNPETGTFASGRILVACGWKPGFSSDYDAVVLAKRFNGECVINLSNIDYVYDSDPRKNPQAKAVKSITWDELTTMIGTTWVPGANLPFDPIAAQLANSSALKAIIAKGTNLDNLINILEDKPFIGTIIG